MITLRPFFSCMLVIALALCMSAAPAPGANEPVKPKGPVTITSLSLTADNKNRTALFEGTVVAKTETMTIYADKMLVSYAEGGSVTKIDATGQVKVVRGERVITSESAVYLAAEEKVIFTGSPRAVEGGNVVTGTKMIYLMQEDRSLVENSKVFIENRKGR